MCDFEAQQHHTILGAFWLGFVQLMPRMQLLKAPNVTAEEGLGVLTKGKQIRSGDRVWFM
jgi:hypothetical protein